MRKYFLSRHAIFVSLALSACSLAPEFQRPQMAMPDGWSNVAGVGHQIRAEHTRPFWQELGSEELNRVVGDGTGAESRPRSGFISHRAGPRPGKSRRISSVSINRCERRRIAELSRI